MADVTVKDVMTHLVVMLYSNDTLHDAARRLAGNSISGAPVVEEGRVIGMISESDLVHAVIPPTDSGRVSSILDALVGPARPTADGHGRTVQEIMNPLVVSIGPDASVWEAATVMERRRVKRLPVVNEEDHLLGIVSKSDLVRAIAKDDRRIREDVTEAIQVLGEELFANLEVRVTDGIATIAGIADRKSTRDLAIKLASRTPGVVEVVDRLTYEVDDRRLRSVRPQKDPVDPRLNWVAEAKVNRGMR